MIASYKLFKITLRVHSKHMPVAIINDDMSIEWVNDDIPNEHVKIALGEIMSDME